MEPSQDISRLLEIMAALRDPQTGCAWDLKQNFKSIVPYTIEEAYEVAEAAAANDLVELRDELGDLLLQVVFYAQMACEASAFNFGDVVFAICSKLIRRHPHIFGQKRNFSPDEVKALWDSIKREEQEARQSEKGVKSPSSILDDVSAGLPALARAEKLQTAAASVGFDWSEPEPILKKIYEETQELADVLDAPDKAEDELGDLLFTVVNLARRLNINPEVALRRANQKFERRFKNMESAQIENGGLADLTLSQLDDLWAQAKLSP